MAKRFNVSIPDALAERLEPHKDKISLSAVMQAALERELAQLSLGEQEKQLRASFKAAATSAWLKRNPHHTKIINAFVEHLFDAAINDGLGDIFNFYRRIYIYCRREELTTKIAANPGRYSDLLSSVAGYDERKRRAIIKEVLWMVEPEDDILGDSIIDFVRRQHKEPSQLLNLGPHYPVDDTGLPHWQDPIWLALCSGPTYNAILEIMDTRIRSMLSDEDIDNFVLDLEGEFSSEALENFILELDASDENSQEGEASQ